MRRTRRRSPRPHASRLSAWYRVNLFTHLVTDFLSCLLTYIIPLSKHANTNGRCYFHLFILFCTDLALMHCCRSPTHQTHSWSRAQVIMLCLLRRGGVRGHRRMVPLAPGSLLVFARSPPIRSTHQLIIKHKHMYMYVVYAYVCSGTSSATARRPTDADISG